MRLVECYNLLELAPGASLDDVKANYRKLAFKYHPDLNPGDARAAQRFTRLNEAYVLLKKNLEAAGPSTEKRTYNAETIRQEEEVRSQTAEPRKPGPFYAKQEEVLRDILNDPFARQVFEDIFSKLKRGDRLDAPIKPTRTLDLEWGRKVLSLDLGKGVVASIKDWATRQMDDHQTVYMPARNLIPGTTMRVEIRHRFAGRQTIEVTLPKDFVVGRPIRLRGLGRRLGPWKGDLYLRLLCSS